LSTLYGECQRFDAIFAIESGILVVKSELHVDVYFDLTAFLALSSKA